MNENSRKIPIVNDLRPAYYDNFHCLAGDCRITCCKGWDITFDKKDYLSLKRQNGSPELNEEIANSVRRIRKAEKRDDQYAGFEIGTKACPMQQENGLCRLQVEKGYQALPQVCQTFPRTEHHSPSGYLERSLTLACEGVLKLLWELPEGIEFRSDPLPDTRIRTQISYNMDEPLYPHFQEMRSWCIDMLQNRALPLPERIMRIGAALEKLPDYEGSIPQWLESVCHPLLGQKAPMLREENRDKLLPLFLSNNLRLMMNCVNKMDYHMLVYQLSITQAFQLTAPTDQPDGSQSQTVSILPWLAARERFEKAFGDRDYFMENVMTALFFHLHMPDPSSTEAAWRSFVNLCNLYSFYRFMAVMSCREGAPADRDGLFESIVLASRMLLHNSSRRASLQDEFFRNNSTSLAHMAVLLSN